MSEMSVCGRLQDGVNPPAGVFICPSVYSSDWSRC